MLVLENKEDNKTYKFFTVDFHHHIGQDESGYESFPIAANGTYEICEKLQSDFIRELKERPDDYRYAPAGGKAVRFHPVLGSLGEGDPRIALTYKFEENIILDQIVVFPSHEAIRLDTDIEYQKCNDQIQKWNELYPHSLRLIGFGRLNPNQFPECRKELEGLVNEKGLRGLKLHPKSEDFAMSTGTDKLKGLLKECARLDLPVIFHTTYGSEVKALADAVNEIMIELIEGGREKDIAGLKLVAGHCTYTTEEVFKVLEHPCIYGELSLLNDPSKYLKLAKRKIDPLGWLDHGISKLVDELPGATYRDLMNALVPLAAGQKWSHKLMLGSDHPFSPYSKTLDVMLALLKKDSPAEPDDIANILGANALRLINPKFYTGIADSSTFEKTTVKAFVKHTLQRRKRIFFEPVIDDSQGGWIDPQRAAISNNSKIGRAYTVLVDETDTGRPLQEISSVAGLEVVDGKMSRHLKS